MGNWLRTNNFLPQTAISSSSTRTRETCDALGFDVPAAFTRTLYHAGFEVMMDVLRNQTADTVLMLGHNPGIADFADRLVSAPPRHPRSADYPTCATAVIRFEAEGWADIGWRSGAPVGFAIPREVML